MKFFKIKEANDIKSFYILEEIDKITRKETYLENRLKRYVNRERIYQLFSKEENNNNSIKEELVKEIEVSRSSSSNNRESIAIIMSSLSSYNYYNYIKV